MTDQEDQYDGNDEEESSAEKVMPRLWIVTVELHRDAQMLADFEQDSDFTLNVYFPDWTEERVRFLMVVNLGKDSSDPDKVRQLVTDLLGAVDDEDPDYGRDAITVTLAKTVFTQVWREDASPFRWGIDQCYVREF